MNKTLISLMLAGAILLAGCTAQQDVYSRPDEKLEADSTIVYEQGLARYTDPAIMIEVAYLSPNNLELYYSMFQGGKYKNPFAPKSHMVFSVTLENRTKSVMNFNPRLTMFITEWDSPLKPKDYTELYAELNLADTGDIESRMEAFMQTGFDNSVIIQPGERVQKLLVFKRVDESRSGGLLVFSNIFTNFKSRDIPIQYQGEISVD